MKRENTFNGKENGAVEYIQLHHFNAPFILGLTVEKGQATGVEPTSLVDSVDITGTPPKERSTAAGASRRGVCGTIAGKAPDGVGNSAASSSLSWRGRKARKAQKNIQAKSTPRSVQDKVICVDEIASDGFIGHFLFYIFIGFSDG